MIPVGVGNNSVIILKVRIHMIDSTYFILYTMTWSLITYYRPFFLFLQEPLVIYKCTTYLCCSNASYTRNCYKVIQGEIKDLIFKGHL